MAKLILLQSAYFCNNLYYQFHIFIRLITIYKYIKYAIIKINKKLIQVKKLLFLLYYNLNIIMYKY